MLGACQAMPWLPNLPKFADIPKKVTPSQCTGILGKVNIPRNAFISGNWRCTQEYILNVGNTGQLYGNYLSISKFYFIYLRIQLIYPGIHLIYLGIHLKSQGISILDLVKLKFRCIGLWEHKKYIHISQIYELYYGNNFCAVQQPYYPLESCNIFML